MSNGHIVTSLESLKSYVGNAGSVTPVSWEDVHTEISLDNPILNSYVEVLYSMLGQELYVNSGQELENLFSLDDFKKYIRFILKERVNFSRGDRRIDFKPTDRNILVPGFISLILEQIGMVSDDDLGLRLIPDHSDHEVLSYQEALKLSRKLTSFEKFGFSFSKGYSREKSGDWEFMMMSVATEGDHPNSQVLGVDPKVHGVKAVLASVVLWRTGVLDALTHRVSYGTTGFFSSLVDSFAAPRKSS